jgi:hypothetical protein
MSWRSRIVLVSIVVVMLLLSLLAYRMMPATDGSTGSDQYANAAATPSPSGSANGLNKNRPAPRPNNRPANRQNARLNNRPNNNGPGQAMNRVRGFFNRGARDRNARNLRAVGQAMLNYSAPHPASATAPSTMP